MAGPSKTVKWIIGVVVVVAVLAVGGPFVYIHFIEKKAAAPLSLSSASTTTAALGATAATSSTTTSKSAGATTGTGTGVDGTWAPTSASTVGYRVAETLFGQGTTAVGRTSKVTGAMSIAGTTLTAATFTVDMTSVTSDQSRRDQQFQGRIMNTATYPTATFTLSSPVDFASVPTEGTVISAKASGKLTLHGTTRDVTVDLKADRTGSNIEVNGSFDVTFSDWGIANPSFGPARTGDTGVLEFLLVLARNPT